MWTVVVVLVALVALVTPIAAAGQNAAKARRNLRDSLK